eukprot:6461672-Amphidinium_carterae.1
MKWTSAEKRNRCMLGFDTKLAAVMLCLRFLRACGATLREEVVWLDASELTAGGESALQAKLTTASRGCLAVHLDSH